MRSDIAKVITERPRAGGGLKSPTGYKKRLQETPLDEQPKGESIRRKWIVNHGGKRFTDVLGPLKGFIRKNAGRPWNKVYSEICKVLPAKGGVSLSHARDHLFDFVSRNVVKMVNGVPYELSAYRGISPCISLAFVHPTSGILLLNKDYQRRYRYRPPEPKGIVLSESIQLHKDEHGVWYELTLQEVPKSDERLYVDDVWLGKDCLYRFDDSLWYEYGRRGVYCVAKRQLRKSEIKRHNLNGGGPIALPNIVQRRNRKKRRAAN